MKSTSVNATESKEKGCTDFFGVSALEVVMLWKSKLVVVGRVEDQHNLWLSTGLGFFL